MQAFADCEPKFVNSILCFRQVVDEPKHDGIRRQIHVLSGQRYTRTMSSCVIQASHCSVRDVKGVGQQHTNLNICLITFAHKVDP